MTLCYFINFHFILSRPDDIYHVTIMPCYDKKLEASRADFYNDMYRTRDVDCVISTSKLLFSVYDVNITISFYSISWVFLAKELLFCRRLHGVLGSPAEDD